MTRSEQAYVKRLQRRNEDLFTALCIIKTWLSFPDDAATRCYHIGRLAEEKIQSEQLARAKESGGADEARNRRVANNVGTAGKPVKNADRFKTADEAIAAAIHAGIVDCRFGAREMAEWLLALAPVTIEDDAE